MIERIIKSHLKLDSETTKEALGKAAELVRGAAVYNLGPHTVDGELAQSITTDVKENEAEIFTGKEYAAYVEFGTGPKGAANHEGISPEVSPAYSPQGWWIHESMIPPGTAERYGWIKVQTKDGVFYKTEGSAAHPYLYPALKDNEEAIVELIKKEILK